MRQRLVAAVGFCWGSGNITPAMRSNPGLSPTLSVVMSGTAPCRDCQLKQPAFRYRDFACRPLTRPETDRQTDSKRVSVDQRGVAVSQTLPHDRHGVMRLGSGHRGMRIIVNGVVKWNLFRFRLRKGYKTIVRLLNVYFHP
ncbi:hypothetical protein J6590_005921 [Homalodisca vitripennis]|nr:hypothetical protein J6590_005921 [Homalodisca vitripennis]